MRGGTRARHLDEEDESAFVSMTDMTVSFLFIVIVLLAFFASQFNDKNVVPRPTYEKVVAERDATQAEAAKLAAQLTQVQGDLSAATEQLKAAEAQALALHVKVKALQRLVDDLETRLRLLAEPDPLEQYLAQAAATRLRILQDLRGQLHIDFPDLRVEVSTDGDALRFQGEGLFQRGSAFLGRDQRAVVEAIAARLDAILPCYALGRSQAWTANCNPSLAIIEAVQIEGHTDSDGDDLANLTLSTTRANATFAAMIGTQPDLTLHTNTRSQPVLSVAGYGRWRPVVANDSDVNKSTNRRIDLRIIMHTPTDSGEIAHIRTLLNSPKYGAAP